MPVGLPVTAMPQKEKEREKEKEGDKLPQGEVDVLNYEDVLRIGKQHMAEPTGEKHTEPNKVVSIMYTSGSTGTPKVLILFQRSRSSTN